MSKDRVFMMVVNPGTKQEAVIPGIGFKWLAPCIDSALFNYRQIRREGRGAEDRRNWAGSKYSVESARDDDVDDFHIHEQLKGKPSIDTLCGAFNAMMHGESLLVYFDADLNNPQNFSKPIDELGRFFRDLLKGEEGNDGQE